jgi:K+-sensing histidine kinase KdpD
VTERDSSNLLTGVVVGGLGPIAVAGALVPLRDHMASTNVALVLVVVVVIAASVGGWAAGAAAAVMSALSFDFFHTQPYLSLSISTGDDVETTLLLLVVGVLVGVLASWGRRQHAAVTTKRDDIERIHRIAEQVAAGADSRDVIAVATAELTSMLELQECRYEAKPYGTAMVRLDRNGAFDPRPRELHYVHGGFELPAAGVSVAVLSRGQEVGRLVLVPNRGVGVTVERRLATVLVADQVGAALAPSLR